ncbi:MmgE/PrpD family protein [uncultured Erythrobacter sp.]|uniref:MmgE/PrpD family protein n=1 Tax=uncultured Erythrobacter sp. TaxID=263913 RepID=UPI00262DE08B|nr:MmgE/PrpD family protein [uncultured Erythrobacter sp.]
MSEPLLSQLSRGLACTVSESDKSRARMHLLDWLACVAGARQSDAAGAAAKLFGSGWERASYLGNVLEMDDVHRTALLHPGPVVWPAAMSKSDVSLDERLEAAVRGYEAMIAVGLTLDAHHYAHWHPTATAGVFGSAAASGSLLGIGEDNMTDALGNAGSVAGGFWHMRHDDVLTKQWHVYHAMRTGIDAAHHANAGVTGPAALLEGPQGLFAAMIEGAGELALVQKGWQINEVSFKPFAACRHAHPTIDAALEAREAGKLVAPFYVETYRDALTFCDRPEPTTELEAKFSLQHAVAVVVDGRQAKPEDFTEDAIAELADLRAQVTVAEDPEITANYPTHFGARVNGFELKDTLGDPERPVSQNHIIDKMRTLADWGGLATAEADRAVELALHGDDASAMDAMLLEWLS